MWPQLWRAAYRSRFTEGKVSPEHLRTLNEAPQRSARGKCPPGSERKAALHLLADVEELIHPLSLFFFLSAAEK